ncbi:MAG: phosphoribosylformylglycinamidine synthase subunit PurQ [Chloroflexota bacterium]|nr:phosphoribosylformylglycinamidine synthase subunit PurQ [Chloroflexota bacterium]MDE2968743.1 phosphoribosylformylglycinamidine synthase subunit PurQ [Chloroflexota bacterium]
MRFGIVVFPGTWSDRDFGVALQESLEQDVRYVWHKERDLSGLDCVVLPGGFAYGDYLRTGAIASLSPVMDSVVTYAERGGLVLGSCNGFQILCEAGLLPGALLRNDHLEFRCEWTHLRVENADTPFTRACRPGDALGMPVSHGEGRYYADPRDLRDLELNNQVVFRYANAEGIPTAEANPNGSFNNIAGIVNKRGNVLGMMPHPERASSELLGGTDGLRILNSVLGERTFA